MKRSGSQTIFLPAARYCLTLLVIAGATGVPAAYAQPAAPGALTLDELKNRLVTYAANISQSSDVSAEHFASATGASFTRYQDGEAGGQVRNQPLSGGYTFHASYLSANDPDSIEIHQLIFITPDKRDLTDRGSNPCLWEADAAGQSLVRAGYSHNGHGTFRRGGMEFYRRQMSDGKMVFDVALLTYESSQAGINRTCVYGMRFSGGRP